MSDIEKVHLDTVIKAVADGRVIPFLGAGANKCMRPENTDWVRGRYLPDGGELAMYLANTFHCPSAEVNVSCPSCNTKLSTAIPDLAHVSQEVAVLNGSAPLYEELHSIFGVDYPYTPLHSFLATLRALLRARGYPRTSDPLRRRLLIVTTNYDDLLEAAFLDAGEKFHVVSYIAAGKYRGGFLHKKPDGTLWPIEIPNQYEGLSRDQDTVILKVHGALDRVDANRDSYVITEDDYIDYLSHVDLSSLLPVPLLAMLQSSNFLFLGYGLRDWNMRVILHRIWGQQRLGYASWAIQQDPQELEKQSWMKRDVKIYNASLQDYVAALSTRLRELPDLGEKE